ncbi:uncharacterized protein [Chlorocebus sabaeus]|uniref:uncharacterized protein isoform X4 n=1 Tax=Chlorocebus sabaeus TaxID=60711 RepID=UPI003BF98943
MLKLRPSLSPWSPAELCEVFLPGGPPGIDWHSELFCPGGTHGLKWHRIWWPGGLMFPRVHDGSVFCMDSITWASPTHLPHTDM